MDDPGEGGESPAVAGGDEPVAVVCHFGFDVGNRIAELHAGVQEQEARQRFRRVADDACFPCKVS